MLPINVLKLYWFLCITFSLNQQIVLIGSTRRLFWIKMWYNFTIFQEQLLNCYPDVQKLVVLWLRFTFFPISLDVRADTGRLPSAKSDAFPLNCWIKLAGKDLKHFSAFSSCLARISFFSFSAFNSLRNCAFDLFPNGQSTRCWIRLMAEGRISGFGWIICCNKEIKLLNLGHYPKVIFKTLYFCAQFPPNFWTLKYWRKRGNYMNDIVNLE